MFSLEEYLDSQKIAEADQVRTDAFDQICDLVADAFEEEWSKADESNKSMRLEREKRAIMGYEDEHELYIEQIREILKKNGLEGSDFPSWHASLEQAVFAEIYGLAGLDAWAYDRRPEYVFSSSAKIIGERIYFLLDGHTVLQPQKISADRRLKLRRALLLATPLERVDKGFHEVYLRNGIRITIFSGSRTKADQDIIVFRKYVLPKLDFEILTERKTIPREAMTLFPHMIKAGFNVLFSGQVRSGKTTFLQIWQSMENRGLEGLAVATDPETPWHLIMPDVPIMQIVADGEQLEALYKSLLRGDNDYVLMEEMRDAAAFKLAVDIATSGTSRCKATVHDASGIDVPYRMASEIVNRFGGNINSTLARIFGSFDYCIELARDTREDRKIMKGILEYEYDDISDCVCARYICRYDFVSGKWLWSSGRGRSKSEKYPQQTAEIKIFERMLDELSGGVDRGWRITPAYYRGAV